MASPHIAFFHIGPDTIYPTVMVRSIRANNPNARIVQCTDVTGPNIAGVDEVVRFEGDSSRPMGFRLECFARLATSGPTLFLDTDMICVRPLDPAGALAGEEAAVCLREYSRDMVIDTAAMDIDLREYAGKTLGAVYPYVGCAVATDGPRFWSACLAEMQDLPSKFRRWFGDQEALRNVIDRDGFKVAWLPESIYACLVDVETDPATNPRICHFKGPARKPLMLDCARQAGLLPA